MKKMLFLLVALAVVVSALPALDLEYGVRGGLVLGNMALDPEFDEWGPESDDQIRFGFYAGIWARHMLNEKMGIMAELDYVQKGDQYKVNETSDDVWFVFYANELELPVMFYYMATDALTVYGGPVLGYVMSGGYKQVVEASDPDISQYMAADLGEFLNRFDFSFAAGAKYDFAGRYFGEVRYTYGFTNLFEESIVPEEIDFVPRTLTIGFGVNL